MRSYIGSAVLAMHEDPKWRKELRRRITEEVQRRSAAPEDGHIEERLASGD